MLYLNQTIETNNLRNSEHCTQSQGENHDLPFSQLYQLGLKMYYSVHLIYSPIHVLTDNLIESLNNRQATLDFEKSCSSYIVAFFMCAPNFQARYLQTGKYILWDDDGSVLWVIPVQKSYFKKWYWFSVNDNEHLIGKW